MSWERACPLLLNAANPLPADSLPRWTKYQRIDHRLTAPDLIELSAKCMTQEEHRFLQDWCQWLVNEVQNAGLAMSRVARHGGWVAPSISLSTDQPTIKIVPHDSANYIPADWTFEIDAQAIFDRLIHDVYVEPLAFVRELLQNALDATRCRLYADAIATDRRSPKYPTEFDGELRDRYPVSISLTETQHLNEMSGEYEKVQVLAIEDIGIGMTSDIIRRYLLQVGRSYYTSEEFRRTYGFVPTSRFGVGFLSVFAVSDNVTVETLSGNPGADKGTFDRAERLLAC